MRELLVKIVKNKILMTMETYRAIINIATQIGMSPSSIFFIILELIVVESFKKLVECYDVVIEVILASAVAAWDIISDVQTQYL